MCFYQLYRFCHPGGCEDSGGNEKADFSWSPAPIKPFWMLICMIVMNHPHKICSFELGQALVSLFLLPLAYFLPTKQKYQVYPLVTSP